MLLRDAIARAFVAVATLLPACAEPTSSQASGAIVVPAVRSALPPLFGGSLAFVGVGVVDPGTGRVEHDRTVLVRDGLITAIGPRSPVS